MTRLALAAAFAALFALPCAAVDSAADSAASRLDPDYAAGQGAHERKDWPAAVHHFGRAALREPENADIQNFLGYAQRNLGHWELAFKHYHRALELNPRHRGAHEYVGEAYLRLGNLEGAQRHLDELRKICLLPCEEFAALNQKIAAYRAGARKPD
jgi:tetratricopeptide (TPR) repeat protein